MTTRKRQMTEEVSGGAKFFRNFEHVDGNWPSFISVNLQHRSLSVRHTAVRKHLQKYNHEIVVEKHPHISLSMPFVLRSHQIEPFLQKLGNSMESLSRLIVCLTLISHVC